MNENHIKLQFRRLKRHYEYCIENIDEINMLDLTHCLRIFTEMSKAIDNLIKEKNFEITFPNPGPNKAIKSTLNKINFTLVPLVSMPQTNSGIHIENLIFGNTNINDDIVKQIYAAGLIKTKSTKLSFEEWLGSEIIEKKYNGERIGIQRKILIKRVANILGASHPEGEEHDDENKNRFDPLIIELHNTKVANGYRLTYYQLIEIASVIIKSFKNLLA